MRQIDKKVQINIPFTMLWDTYADEFLKRGLNPEIGIDAVALERFNRQEFGDMAAQLLNRGLTITVHGPFIDMFAGSLDPLIRAATRHRFEQMLDLIPLFKPKTVVCHAGYEWKRYGYLREEWTQNSIETWRWLGDHVKAAGSRLMLENVFEQEPEEIRILFEQLTEQDVGFCLDTGHQAAFSRASLATWLDSLGGYLGQLHLHDNRGQQDEHMALGQGRIDFELFFKRLKYMMKTPPVITLEPHDEESLEPSLDYMEKIWPWAL